MTVYLDYNATSPLCASAIQAMNDGMQWVGNPSSVHAYGRKSRQEIERARQDIANSLGVSSQRVIFTSGATEANNMALVHFPGRVLVSAIEHDSVRFVRPDALMIPVTNDGVVDLQALENLLAAPYDGPTLISVMAAHNETGVIQPLADIVALAKQYKACVHSDCVQGVGRFYFPWETLSMMSLSAHKIGGPAGVGCLIIHPDWPLNAFLKGGGQERSLRPGTENMIGIMGMAAALRQSRHQDWSQTNRLRISMEKALLTLSPDSNVIGQQAIRLPNTILITMPGVKSETQVMNFDLQGFAVSSGSACSSGKVRLSPSLQAMGVPKAEQETALRVSLNHTTSEDEVESFIQVWSQIYERCSKRSHFEQDDNLVILTNIKRVDNHGALNLT